MRKTRIDFVIPFVFAYGLGYLINWGGEKIIDELHLRLSITPLAVLIGIATFFLIRYVLIASGFCPPLFPLRFLPNWKRYISYYGVIYYDENVDQIFAYHKQQNFEAAAQEFAKLTQTDIMEARCAINQWHSIAEEGIL